MKKKQIFLTVSAITLVFLSTFTSISTNLLVFGQPKSSLTGNIYDQPEDTDSDGLYNLLVINVEVNVSESATYRVTVESVSNIYYNRLYVNVLNETYLNPGLQNVTILVNGIILHGGNLAFSRVTVSFSYTIDYSSYYETLSDRLLSRTYDYTSFDPGASFTGTISDEGVDADMNGLFEYLQVGVEINVTDEATYQVGISGLTSSYYNYVGVYNSTQELLLVPGLQTINVSLYGATIYGSHVTDISRVSTISLQLVVNYPGQTSIYNLASEYYINLSRTYSHSEFETPAYFTGALVDKGIDTDGDSKYEYLEIDVRVNVTEAGNYALDINSLKDSGSNYAYVYGSTYGYFETGVQWVNLTITVGPQIHQYHVNPSYIGDIYLNSAGFPVDHLTDVPLPVSYSYIDFDPYALLTGNITDIGVDTDADGLYDYLAVGVEINVTENGTYRISAQGLQGQGIGTTTLYDYKYADEYFNVGTHTVYLNFSAYSLVMRRFSPSSIFTLELIQSVYPYLQLGSMESAMLSRMYNYALFDAPLNDMHVNITVYPDGTMGIEGMLNSTHLSYSTPTPLVNATVALSTSGNTTTGIANGTCTMPPGMWPYNATNVNLSFQQNGELTSLSASASMILLPQMAGQYPFNATNLTFNSQYSGGTLIVDLLGETQLPPLPFNITDAVVQADYDGNVLTGNITFRSIAGLPVADVVLDFVGNETHLELTGSINVTYGTFFDTEVNATMLDEMLANFTTDFVGPEGIISNMTWNLLECTRLNTSRTPIMSGSMEVGSTVDYNATIGGNFTGFFARLLSETVFQGSSQIPYETIYAILDSALSSVKTASTTLIYYDITKTATFDLHLATDTKAFWNKAIDLIPPTAPPEAQDQVLAMIRIANSSINAMEDFSLSASYLSGSHKLDMNVSLLANNTQLKEDMVQILPDMYPSPLHEIIESYMNETYVNLTDATATATYADGKVDFVADWVLEGDLKTQVNQGTRFYIDVLNATSPYMLGWQWLMLNMTEVNINNFRLDVQMSQDNTYVVAKGFFARPSIDETDFIRFKFYRLLELASGNSFPSEFERLQIQMTGGFNGTHTVLLYAPDTVIVPDMTSHDYKMMMWNNVSLSSLKDLNFQIAYQGIVDYLGNTYYVPVFTNSTVSQFGFNPNTKSISFNASGTTGTGFCKVTIPRILLNASTGDWKVKLDGIDLTASDFSVSENEDFVFVYLNYTHSTHSIEIGGTMIVPEFPPNMLPLVLIALTLIGIAVALKRRKKLDLLRIAYVRTLWFGLSFNKKHDVH